MVDFRCKSVFSSFSQVFSSTPCSTAITFVVQTEFRLSYSYSVKVLSDARLEAKWNRSSLFDFYVYQKKHVLITRDSCPRFTVVPTFENNRFQERKTPSVSRLTQTSTLKSFENHYDFDRSEYRFIGWAKKRCKISHLFFCKFFFHLIEMYYYKNCVTTTRLMLTGPKRSDNRVLNISDSRCLL